MSASVSSASSTSHVRRRSSVRWARPSASSSRALSWSPRRTKQRACRIGPSTLNHGVIARMSSVSRRAAPSAAEASSSRPAEASTAASTLMARPVVASRSRWCSRTSSPIAFRDVDGGRRVAPAQRGQRAPREQVGLGRGDAERPRDLQSLLAVALGVVVVPGDPGAERGHEQRRGTERRVLGESARRACGQLDGLVDPAPTGDHGHDGHVGGVLVRRGVDAPGRAGVLLGAQQPSGDAVGVVADHDREPAGRQREPSLRGDVRLGDRGEPSGQPVRIADAYRQRQARGRPAARRGRGRPTRSRGGSPRRSGPA